MSYKIRYGYDRHRQIPTKQLVCVQCLVSGGMLLLLGLARFWSGDNTILAAVLSSSPMTVAERAVSALSCALARGEGWYQSLAVWCRTIIDGAAV